MTLSVAIIAHNEEANLPRTLASVCWANEIVVVDAFSTDRTAEIAAGRGARVLQRAWPGFAAQKNFALEQCTGAWVLSLDADEELTPELAAEIQEALAGTPTVDAFCLKRRNLFLGRWMRHGGFYPDAKLRLFRRQPATAAPPRFHDRAVHETLAFAGPTATLRHDLVHHAYPTLAAYIEHMDRYSSLGAEVLAARGRRLRSLPAFVGRVLLAPLAGFAYNYILRLGFLDGREGLLLHLYHAVYASWKYAKLWQGSEEWVRSKE